MGMDKKSKSRQIRLFFYPRPKENRVYMESQLSTSYAFFGSSLGLWCKWGANEGWVSKLGAKFSPEHPGIWHQFAFKNSVVVGLQ